MRDKYERLTSYLQAAIRQGAQFELASSRGSNHDMLMLWLPGYHNNRVEGAITNAGLSGWYHYGFNAWVINPRGNMKGTRRQKVVAAMQEYLESSGFEVKICHLDAGTNGSVCLYE